MTRYGKRVAPGRSYGRREDESQVMARRLIQLVVCLGIFTTVYVTKGVFPYKVQRLGENVTTLVTTTTDIRGAFSDLGDALSQGESVVAELGDFCVTVFGGTVEEDSAVAVLEPQKISVESQSQVNQTTESDAISDSNSDSVDELDILDGLFSEITVDAEETVAAVEEEAVTDTASYAIQAESAAVQAVGTVIQENNGDGQDLPVGYTVDLLSLGALEWTTPVLGVLSSGFGYRIHPLSGQNAIHNGLDIVGAVGDPIYAFASGTVEYIGESDEYGLYLRIDHGDGVASFYAHCSELLVHKGDAVTMGDVIALVGATGNVTGAHLHFELRYNDLYLDPALYIDTL